MTRDRVLRIACLFVAVSAAGSLAFVYGRYLSREEWPPGHPWAAISMLFASIMVVLTPARNRFSVTWKIVLSVLIFVMSIYAVRVGLR